MKRIRKAVRGFKTQIVLSFIIVSIIPLIGIGLSLIHIYNEALTALKSHVISGDFDLSLIHI